MQLAGDRALRERAESVQRPWGRGFAGMLGNRAASIAGPSEPGEQAEVTRANPRALRVIVRTLALTLIDPLMMDEETRLREN